MEAADIERIKLDLNSIFNAADRVKNIFEKPASEPVSGVGFLFGLPNMLGRVPVRTVAAGCPGGQKGFSVTQPSFLKEFATAIGAKSVIDFSPFAENEDTSDFQCPGYKKDGVKCTYVVRYGSGIRKCPQCGMEATCN